MGDEVYHRLAKVLDTLPNGFPASESGVEIRLLKKIFTPDEADLFCDLKFTTYETAEQIAERTGRPLEGLHEKLTTMEIKGQIRGAGPFGFRMWPWIFGIYEMQQPRLDREFAELNQEYHQVYGKPFFEGKPQLMQVIPIEARISGQHEALPYHQVSNIIEKNKSFMVFDCICKKEQHLLDNGCDKPVQVCMAMAPLEGLFENDYYGQRVLTKQEAYEVLNMAEEAGLVHLTWNVQEGHFFICNCCGCCCGVLTAINKHGIHQGVNSHYFAEIDPDECTLCGVCADERCQVMAIGESDAAYEVDRDKCIGCGLCATTCPAEAITLIQRATEDLALPPQDENSWNEERGRRRGVDFNAYK